MNNSMVLIEVEEEDMVLSLNWVGKGDFKVGTFMMTTMARIIMYIMDLMDILGVET